MCDPVSKDVNFSCLLRLVNNAEMDYFLGWLSDINKLHLFFPKWEWDENMCLNCV